MDIFKHCIFNNIFQVIDFGYYAIRPDLLLSLQSKTEINNWMNELTIILKEVTFEQLKKIKEKFDNESQK